MKEYLLLLRGYGPSADKTPAVIAKELKAWDDYITNLKSRGVLVGSMPVVPKGVVISAEKLKSAPVSSPAEEIVSGYLILKADSLSQAIVWARSCPHISKWGKIEVREVTSLAGIYL